MPGYAEKTASHSRPTSAGRVRSGIFFKYLYAVAAVLLTFAVALSLNKAMGVRSLSLLFLFPVIAAAARLGIKEALLAALLSTILFNIFFLEPVNVFRPVAAQTWIMLAVLGSLAIYTAAITARLRAEAAASRRRSEAEQSLAAFAATLLRQRNRSSVVHEICTYFRDVFGVHALVLGEDLQVNFAPPPSIRLTLPPSIGLALHANRQETAPTTSPRPIGSSGPSGRHPRSSCLALREMTDEVPLRRTGRPPSP